MFVKNGIINQRKCQTPLPIIRQLGGSHHIYGWEEKAVKAWEKNGAILGARTMLKWETICQRLLCQGVDNPWTCRRLFCVRGASILVVYIYEHSVVHTDRQTVHWALTVNYILSPLYRWRDGRVHCQQYIALDCAGQLHYDERRGWDV